MKNKFISALVSIGMVFGLTPVVAFADDTTDDSQASEPIVQIVDNNNDNPTDEVPNAIVGDSTTNAQDTPGDETIVETDDESSDIEDEFYTGDPNAPPAEDENNILPLADLTSNPVVSESGPNSSQGPLSITKQSDYSIYDVGDLIHYTVTIKNGKYNPRPPITITDTITEGTIIQQNSVNVQYSIWDGSGSSNTYPSDKQCDINVDDNSMTITINNGIQQDSNIIITYDVLIQDPSLAGQKITNNVKATFGFWNLEADVTVSVTKQNTEPVISHVTFTKNVIGGNKPEPKPEPKSLENGEAVTYALPSPSELPEILNKTEFTFHFTADIPTEWEGYEIPDGDGATFKDIDETFVLSHFVGGGENTFKEYYLPEGTVITIEEIDIPDRFEFVTSSATALYGSTFELQSEEGANPITGIVKGNGSINFQFVNQYNMPELKLGTIVIYKDVLNLSRPRIPQVPVYSLDKPVTIANNNTTPYINQPNISVLEQTEFTFHFTADIPEEWEGTEIPDSDGAVWQDIDETFTLTHTYDSDKYDIQRWKEYTLPVGTTFTIEEVTDQMSNRFSFEDSYISVSPSDLATESNITGVGTNKISGTIAGEATYRIEFDNLVELKMGMVMIAKLVEQGSPIPPPPPVYSLNNTNADDIDYDSIEFHFHITADVPEEWEDVFPDIDEDFTLTNMYKGKDIVSAEMYYLPVGTTFTITEKQDVPNFAFTGGQVATGPYGGGIMTSSSFDTPTYVGEITEEAIVYQIIYNNTYREQTFGSLQIKKNVETNSPAYYDRLNKADDVFTFEVTIGDNPTETITLKAGETSKLFENIPTGTAYTIKEINLPDGYSVEDATITGTIQGEETETVEFNNTWTYSPSDLYLTIGKVVDIPAGWQAWYDKSTGGTDTFTIVVNIAGVETEYTLTNGQIIQIPVKEGSIYTVYEKDVEDPYSFVKISVNGVDTTQEKVQGRITGDTKVIVTNTWTFDIGDQWVEFPTVTPEPEYGSLTLTKTVLASNNVLYNHFADIDTEFTFEVTINGKTQVVKLKNNESWSIDNLPIGTTYKIEEVDIPDGYTALANPIMGTIMKENKDVSVKFVNKWDMPIKPGPFPEFGVIPDPEPDPEPGPKPDPVDPVDPVDPTEPTDPVEPTDPTEPETPTQPEEPECWIPQGSQTSPQTGYDYIDTPWGKLPKTGDNETILLVSTFSLIGAAAIALLLIGRRKMKKD